MKKKMFKALKRHFAYNNRMCRRSSGPWSWNRSHKWLSRWFLENFKLFVRTRSRSHFCHWCGVVFIKKIFLDVWVTSTLFTLLPRATPHVIESKLHHVKSSLPTTLPQRVLNSSFFFLSIFDSFDNCRSCQLSNWGKKEKWGNIS